MDKCLAFCQALITSDQKFTLNLSIGNDKLFFSNKELESSWKKKKKSPSQLRREKNRKMKRQKEATEKVAGDGASEAAAKEAEDNSTAEKAEGPASIVCEECDYNATTEKGLKQHKRMKHGKPQQSTLSTPETSRRPSRPEHLNTSPLLQSTREEACHNCGGIFTSEHQCDTQCEIEGDKDEGYPEVKSNDEECDCRIMPSGSYDRYCCKNTDCNHPDDCECKTRKGQCACRFFQPGK